MKNSNFTSLLLSVILTFLFWIIPDYVSADLRQQYPPSPCHYNYSCGEPDLSADWLNPLREPKQKMFCVDFNNCPNCCYRITYYEFVDVDTTIPIEHLTDEYFLNIVDIQWMGSNSCCEKDKHTIKMLFLDSLLNEKIQDSTFLHLNLSHDKKIKYLVLTPAICMHGDSVCSDTSCCLQAYDFNLDPDSANYHKSILLFSRLYCDVCDTASGCQPSCDEFPYRQNWINCCDSIQVTSQKIDSTCCINVSVYNPYCWDPAPDIIFQQFNTLTHTFLAVPNGTINCPMGQTVNYTMCPTNGDYFVIWRVKISKKDSSAIPNCGTSFIEGKTMYTDTVDLSSCCKCDANWLIVTVVKDTTCPDSECTVRFILNIPDSITCYKYYVTENISGAKNLPPKNLKTQPISDFNYCLSKGQFGTVKVYLLQNLGEILDSACIISKGVACDTATVDCCPPNHNNWLTTFVVKDPTCLDSNGCRVFMDLNLDSIPPCFHYYYVQGIDSEIVAGYNDLYNQPISSVQYCIGAGQSGTIKVTLVNNYQNPDTMCTISQFVSCDSLTEPDTLQPCASDCIEDWTKDMRPINLGDTCSPGHDCILYVFFEYRKCQDSIQEIQLLGITYSDSCYCLNEGEMIQKAIEWLITDDPMHFFPDVTDTGCSEQWRVTIHTCWRYYEDDMRPCPTGCCWQKYKVCRDINHHVSIEPIGETVRTFDQDTCLPFPPRYSNPNTCYDMCDYLSISVEMPAPHIIRLPINPSENSLENINLEEKYSDGILNLSMKSDCGDIMRVDITDVYGTKLFSYEQTLKTIDVNFSIDTHSLERGYYVYKIYCNGNYLGNGKFVVE